jgi:hypothetical protein
VTSPPPVIPGAVLLYSFMLPPSWRGLFFFLPRAVWRPLRLSTAFFFPGIYFHSLLHFFQCAPRVAFVRLSQHISAGYMVLSAALYRTFAPLRYAHSRPILQPVPGLCSAAPLRPWTGCALAPAAPKGPRLRPSRFRSAKSRRSPFRGPAVSFCLSLWQSRWG